MIMITITLGYGIVVKSGLFVSLYLGCNYKMCLERFRGRDLACFSYVMVLYVVLVLFPYIKCICFVVI